MTDHPATVEPTTYGKHVATCPCGWMGADWADEERANEDAQLHREGKRRAGTIDPSQEPVEPRSLGEMPFEGV